MRLLTVPLLPSALLLLAGCPQDPCDAAAAADPVLTLGVGEKDFTPLQDGDTVEYDYGNQGGHHVWVGLHTSGIHPGEKGFLTADTDAPTLELSIVGAVDGAEYGSYFSNWVALDGRPDDAEIVGLQLVMGGDSWYDTTPTEEPVEQDHVLVAHVADVCGNELDAEVRVVLPD